MLKPQFSPLVPQPVLDWFGHEDFEAPVPSDWPNKRCPIAGCDATLDAVSHAGTTRRVCRTHGIRLHPTTFVYVDDRPESRPELRNLVVRRDLAEQVLFHSSGKVDTRYLAHELSEDALTWNVFVGLAEAGRLADATRQLTGRAVSREPTLYLWGELVDVRNGERSRYPPLERVRAILEPDVLEYPTEPDIMLVIDGELIVCIEAKFTSANPLSDNEETKPGQKPSSRADLIARYYERAGEVTRRSINPEQIPDPLHSQLFRNVVFATEMGGSASCHVVNLTSSTTASRKHCKPTPGYSLADPTGEILGYLVGPKTGFTYRTWEDLYHQLIAPDSALAAIADYMRRKSAHFGPAFGLGG